MLYIYSDDKYVLKCARGCVFGLGIRGPKDLVAARQTKHNVIFQSRTGKSHEYYHLGSSLRH
jgi:hypothetical protein